MEKLRLRAYGKINLTLDVLGKYQNGYHEVSMIMQQISLYDDVLVRWYPSLEYPYKKISKSLDEKYKIEDLLCDIKIKVGTNRYYIPTDNRNLAYKAVEVLADKINNNEIKIKTKPLKGTVRIDIKKRIPVAAGLAGGSSNCAAVLHGLNKLWNLGLSLEELCSIGETLGADVPFCLMGQAKINLCLGEKVTSSNLATTAALATGTGTELEPIESLDAFILLSKPPMSVSTAEVYGNLNIKTIEKHPDNLQMIEGIKERNLDKIRVNAINVLEEYTLKKYDRVRETKEKMVEACPQGIVTMSGSGPTVICIANEISNIEEGYLIMKSINKETYKTRTMV